MLFTTLPAGFVETQVGGGVDRPTAMEFAPDGRLFVCEQGRNGVGKVRVIEDGVLLPTPFLTVSVDATSERGVDGIAFDPDFSKNGFVYIYYTSPQGGAHNRVSRFTANGDVAAADSEKILLDLAPLGADPIHNGGSLNFGADGKLLIAVGENGQPAQAQSLQSTLGKILRINSDGSIPIDNPFYDQTYGNNRAIWALGLRNPFTTAVQPGTGRYFINDVGQNTWEEIDEGVAGANYGWPGIEGPIAGQTPPPNYRDPIYAYNHNGGGRSITGGDFYNPNPAHASFPAEYLGKYFWGELILQQINVFDPATGASSPFASGVGNITDIDIGPDGALYYTRYGSTANPASGRIFRIVNAVASAPEIVIPPRDVTVVDGFAATLTVGAVGSGELRYQWRRDGEDIEGANSASYTVPFPDTGLPSKYSVVVSNDLGSVTSDPVRILVAPSVGPRVTSVSVGDINWSANFQKVLGGTFFEIPAGADQLTPIPFASLNTIQLTFDVPMSDVPQRISLTDSAGQSVRSFSVSSSDAQLRVVNYYADGIIPNPVDEAGRYSFTIASDQAVSMAGQDLNGEWINGQSQFPSGDNAPGGNFTFRFNVVPGDVNRDGVVNAADLVQVRNRVGRTSLAHGATPFDYSAYADLNGDAVINATDLVLVRNRAGTALPPLPAAVFSQRRLDLRPREADCDQLLA